MMTPIDISIFAYGMAAGLWGLLFGTLGMLFEKKTLAISGLLVSGFALLVIGARMLF